MKNLFLILCLITLCRVFDLNSGFHEKVNTWLQGKKVVAITQSTVNGGGWGHPVTYVTIVVEVLEKKEK